MVWVFVVGFLLFIGAVIADRSPLTDGEKRVMRQLHMLNPATYVVFHDILIPNEQSKSGTSQIDHIVLSPFGIFIIETKDYRGAIYGSPADRYWTQKSHGYSYRFNNPLRQNYGHITAVQALLGDLAGTSPIVPIVVFAGSAILQVQAPENEPVISIQDLLQTIGEHQEPFLTKDQVTAMSQRIEAANLTGQTAHRQHTRNIHNALYNEQIAVEQGICPRCGGHLVPRLGRYGPFLGCSNYPSCHYTST